MSIAPHDLAVKTAQARRAFDGAALRGVCRLGEARPSLGDDVLLHAGPPLGDADVPHAIRNAAIHALVHGGRDAGAAAEALDRGAIRLAPAQDHGVVTPLAQVVSSAMPVFRVGDEADEVLAPLAESAPPALRFGSADPVCVVNLRAQAQWALDVLAGRLAEAPLPVVGWIERGLAAGDECHARVGVVNAAFRQALGELPADYARTIEDNANFVLPVLMAASAWALRRRGGSIAAAGGNGVEFGLRFPGDVGWRTVAATPPAGVYLPGREQAPVLGAVGDSPVIDFCGLGGQALAFAADLLAAWAEVLPPARELCAESLLEPDTGLVCRHRVVHSGRSPLVNLAMVDASAAGGLVGRGVYAPGVDLFRG
ncbi:DUF1116 domain-containing protein [Salinisphaera orenii]|uniref:oxamate carbamoyltransferase subunit AllG family protein n=1 Tax=Salinisphaera orenii TaxID=856731 RepID=UPI001FE618A1|nr:DUF1116 domain-containing protein [Salinisphaera orenii]